MKKDNFSKISKIEKLKYISKNGISQEFSGFLMVRIRNSCPNQ